MHKDDAYSTSLAFGLTACNPQSVRSDLLPGDSHLLLDRPEYWVVKKDIANSPNTKDVLAFTVSSTGKGVSYFYIKYNYNNYYNTICFIGEVTMSVNGGTPVFQMHVDNSVPLWAFFDMYGTTDRIRCVGSLKKNISQPHQCEHFIIFLFYYFKNSIFNCCFSTFSAQVRRNKDSFVVRASKSPSTSKFSQANLQSQSLSVPSTSVTAREYFELSQSPNSMKTTTALVANNYLSVRLSLLITLLLR